MADAEYTFAQARARLEDIVGEVRRKDVPLEKSLDLLEEGVRLANACTEHIDHTEWRREAEEMQAEDGGEGAEAAAAYKADAADAETARESPDSPPADPASEA